jgi:hypothetical protein
MAHDNHIRPVCDLPTVCDLQGVCNRLWRWRSARNRSTRRRAVPPKPKRPEPRSLTRPDDSSWRRVTTALFEAVFIAVEIDLVMAAAQNLADPAKGALNQLRQGLVGFLDASLTPHVQQILLIDGPAVLGWTRWRELESVYGLGAIRAMLEKAVEEGDLAPGQPVDVLAHVLLAAADETALFIANAPDQHAARDQGIQALNALLDGLRAG